MKRKIEEKSASIISVVTGICITALAAAGFLLFIPRLFAITPYIVMSGSMEPAIHTGAIAYVNTKPAETEIGDIITFRISGRPVTHRVNRINDPYIYTRGDANPQEDPVPVKKEQIIGTVCLTLPYLGYLAAWIQTKQGTISLLLLLLFHMLSHDIRQEKPDNKKSDIKKKGERTLPQRKV